MAPDPNALRWNGAPGFYEVWYATLTDRGSGCGAWIRYTLTAPLEGPATGALWFLVMDPSSPSGAGVLGRQATFPIERLTATRAPFGLTLGGAELADTGMTGAFEDVAWDLGWKREGPAREPVHPVLRRARIAKTVLVLPHPDVAVTGTLRFGGRTLTLDGARGAQTHLWGTKHATRWAWARCGDFEGLDGSPRPDTWIEGVSVVVPRLGREVGPSTPMVGRFAGEDFTSTSPVRVVRNASRFGLTGWSFAARDGARRISGEVTADRAALAGVTYHDPDGELAHCYNGETATMRVQVWEGDVLRDSLVAPGRAHFEYAQREPVPGLELVTR